MSFFDSLLLNTICILFPLFVYLIYLAYSNNINEKDNYENILFELVLISALFLTIRLIGNKVNNYTIILINIPILFSYLKGKRIFSLFLSIIVVNYYVFFLGHDLYFTLMEYAFYYMVYELSNRKNMTTIYIINSFTLIKAFFLSFYAFTFLNTTFNSATNLKNIFISLIVFYICSNLYYNLLLKGEEIVNLNNSLKELEKEKTLKKSLFKLTHEIKNPIAVCKGYLDMFDINNVINSKRYISIIKSEINRTLVLMDDFLDYTKIKVNKNIMDINYLLEDTLYSMNSFFKNNDVVLKSKIKDEEIFINADYNRLKQVLVNVLKNSIESKQENKKLKISVSSIINESDIEIIISDNGIGMNKDELNSLGEPFYTTKQKGTGLGVSLSKEIIQLHNGKLIYSSEKNKGTTVKIVLPC